MHKSALCKAMSTSPSLKCSVEDTDQARSTPESEAAVIEDLKWVGIKWDEGAMIIWIAECYLDVGLKLL